jgi:hypothetical protein
MIQREHMRQENVLERSRTMPSTCTEGISTEQESVMPSGKRQMAEAYVQNRQVPKLNTPTTGKL